MFLNLLRPIARHAALLLPIGILAAIAFGTVPEPGSGAASEESIQSVAAGAGGAGRRSNFLSRNDDEGEKRRGLFSGWGKKKDDGAADRRNVAAAPRKVGPSKQEITISKSTAVYDFSFAKRDAGRWKYLSSSVRRQIDAARINRGRWRYIVIHNSATTKGSASVFDRYHRQVKGMENGLAYHFVIGNGSYTKQGQIEVGDRWTKQLDGGHLKSTFQNRMSIGICLVGDFNSEKVRKEQLEAMDELVKYLRAKTGKIEVTTHQQINVVPTDCPGRYFPAREVGVAYNGRR
ncbi:MAG: peptidoglycan recognition family protein [Verrucomicrobiales bacterium]